MPKQFIARVSTPGDWDAGIPEYVLITVESTKQLLDMMQAVVNLGINHLLPKPLFEMEWSMMSVSQFSLLWMTEGAILNMEEGNPDWYDTLEEKDFVEVHDFTPISGKEIDWEVDGNLVQRIELQTVSMSPSGEVKFQAYLKDTGVSFHSDGIRIEMLTGESKDLILLDGAIEAVGAIYGEGKIAAIIKACLLKLNKEYITLAETDMMTDADPDLVD